jgi:riboflavin biosynthesis pyrimidine reductase
VRQLFPPPDDVPTFEVEATYAGLTLPAGSPRPHVALGMVSSVDGGAALAGVTAELGGEADHHAFRALRGAADVILVGAGTVRDEGYGPPRGTQARRDDRVARGLAPVPRLAIVTGRVDLDPDLRVFSEPTHRPLVVTHDAAPADALARVASVADVVQVGADVVDLEAALLALASLGLRRVLCEGGPRLNDALLRADLVDELFLTIAPTLLGGAAPRILHGDGEASSYPLTLVGLLEHEGELLLRYRRAR